MSFLNLKPGQAGQEVIAKIRMDASQPASHPAPSFKPNANKGGISRKTAKKSFHNKSLLK